MDKIKDFITNNKFLVAVVILVSLIILVLIIGRFNVEGMEVASLSKFVNKDVYLKFMDGNKAYYLSVASNATCGITQNKDECSNNVVVLQEAPDRFSRMILSFNPYGNPKRYSIISSLKDIQPPYPQLAQSLNFRGVNKLCFDNSTQDDVISFDIEENNGKYRIKYKKDTKFFFIGLCDDKTLCGKFRRLCIYEDQAKAINFDVELAPAVTTETFDSLPLSKEKPKIQERQIEVNRYQQTPDDVMSIESLEGYDSNPLLGSNIEF